MFSGIHVVFERDDVVKKLDGELYYSYSRSERFYYTSGNFDAD